MNLYHYARRHDAQVAPEGFVPLTLAQAKTLHNRTTLYHATMRNADGTALRARVTSVRTWKTRPGDVLVTTKYGYKSVYYRISEADLAEWSLSDPTQVAQEAPSKEDVERILPYI